MRLFESKEKGSINRNDTKEKYDDTKETHDNTHTDK